MPFFIFSGGYGGKAVDRGDVIFYVFVGEVMYIAGQITNLSIDHNVVVGVVSCPCALFWF